MSKRCRITASLFVLALATAPLHAMTRSLPGESPFEIIRARVIRIVRQIAPKLIAQPNDPEISVPKP